MKHILISLVTVLFTMNIWAQSQPQQPLPPPQPDPGGFDMLLLAGYDLASLNVPIDHWDTESCNQILSFIETQEALPQQILTEATLEQYNSCQILSLFMNVTLQR